MATKNWTGATSGDINVAGNWSPSGVPSSGDTVWFNSSAVVAVTAGLTQWSSTAPDAVNVTSGYTGTIGTFASPLTLAATTINVGLPEGGTAGTGSGRLHIAFGSVTFTANIHTTASTATDTGVYPLRIKGGNASSVINLFSGSLSHADQPGESATVGTLYNIGGTVNQGSGVTQTTVTSLSGAISTASGGTTANIHGGTYRDTGVGAWTTASIGGSASFGSTGTVTTLNVTGQGTADFTTVSGSKTITNCNADNGATITDPLARVVFTNGIIPSLCSAADLTLNLGVGRKVTPA